MATTYKIHPAIGIARLGNSPDDFFISPELVGQQPNPAGGFKDAQCRVKRQAAKFRVFAHHDDGSVTELDASVADISWTVHLVNKKAANPARGNSGSAASLTIDPGPRTVDGPNQRKLFDTGVITLPSAPATTVPLGEVRTDGKNHLLVLGGFGNSASPTATGIGDFWKNPGWYDDIADGPVTATIKIHSDGSTPPVAGSWVIVAPPKFAPHQDNVMTLYDRVLDTMITAGLVPAPTTTSYTNDIYPILQRARDIRWVINLGSPTAMTWPDPVTSDALRTAIFNSLKVPPGFPATGGDMPVLNPPDTGDDPGGPLTDRLTPTQYAHMQRWSLNNYAQDWSGPPAPQAAITPDGLDRAALEACAGGSFYPGIEAGGLPQTSGASEYPGLPADSRPIINSAHYVEAFRLNHGAVSAGDITAAMALPWQADFYYCANNWWPVPRPDQVTRGGVLNQGWIDGVVGSAPEMVTKWNQLGFVVRQGTQHIEVARCSTSSINLLTPLLNFQDIPQGPMGMVREAALAIVFEVVSPSSAVTLQYAPGGAPSHPLLSAFNTSVTVGPTAGNTIATAKLWIVYKALNAGDVLPPQTVTVQDSGATQSWTVTIIGDTVARKTAAAALVLDRSGSMSEDRGDGQSKHDSLQQACGIFVDVMLEGDGVGLVSFNQTATVLQPITALGDGGLSDASRGNTKDIINGNGLDPNGSTSIGNGIQAGRGILNSSAPFDVKSLVVLTDGMENTPLFIADVAASIDEFTYSIGLGKPQDISVPALQAISGNNGGYLLVTGSIGTDNRFLLEKYFLQILAGVSNAEIVLDPSGLLIPGHIERIPFLLTDADAGVDVILLTPNVEIVDFRLQTPSGAIIEPWLAMSDPTMRYVSSNGVSYYRVVLPTELSPNRLEAGGTWNALLTIGKPRIEKGPSDRGVDLTILRGNLTSAAGRPRPARGASTQRQSRNAAVAFNTFAAAPASVNYRSVPYSLIVHAYSNVSLQAHVEQSSFEPGATIDLFASLAQSGIPLAAAAVWAEVVRPDNVLQITALKEGEPGQFSGKFATTIPGVYRMRFRSRGVTLSGQPFVREKTLTAAVWRGGDVPQNPGGGGQPGTTGSPNPQLCELIRCFLAQGGPISPELEKQLAALGLDVEKLRKCVTAFCPAKPCNC